MESRMPKISPYSSLLELSVSDTRDPRPHGSGRLWLKTARSQTVRPWVFGESPESVELPESEGLLESHIRTGRKDRIACSTWLS